MRNVFWLRPGVIGGRTGPNDDSWDPKLSAEGFQLTVGRQLVADSL